MNVVKSILAIVLGFIAGSFVNMGLITLGPHAIPLPEGVNPADMESFKASVHLLSARHYVVPFLAHALGTFAGAFVTLLTAPRGPRWPAWCVGALFLLGGIAASFMIPAPKSFIALDLLFAYVPMAWLAIRLRERIGAGPAQNLRR